MVYRLSPSDFTFLYEGCKRCFYRKVVQKISQPSIPLPAVFSRIAVLLKDHYTGKETSEVHPALPPGVVKYGEQRVRSQPIRVPGHDAACFINGRFDIVVDFADGTYGVIDFKTGNPKEEYVALYSRQLHAYAYALEHPARGALHLSPITTLGLLYFYPSRISQQRIEQLAYEADITWIEIPKDEPGFLRFMGELLAVLESPHPPEPAPDCIRCAYAGKLGEG
jgi:hypothetical protein